MDRGAQWATVHGLQRVRHDWAYMHTYWGKLHTHTHTHTHTCTNIHTKREPVQLEVHSSFQQWEQKSSEAIVLWGCVGWTPRKRNKTGVTDMLTCTEEGAWTDTVSKTPSHWQATCLILPYFYTTSIIIGASLVAQMVKNLPEMQETWVWSDFLNPCSVVCQA